MRALGSILTWLHFEAKVRSRIKHFDGCVQQTFEVRRRARQGANLECATYITDARNPSLEPTKGP